MTQWVVTVAALPWLNANQRLHHHRRADNTAKIREAAGWAAKAAGVPHLGEVFVLGYFHPPAEWARWEPANFYPSFKAAVDGALVDAGVVTDDDHTRVSGPHMYPAHKIKLGALTLVISPAARCLCGHDRVEHPGESACVRPGCGCLRPRGAG